MNRRLALILGVLVAAGATVTFLPRAAKPKATRIVDRRCRGGCSDSALLRVLQGGPSSSQLATGQLQTSKGVPVTVTRASNKTCTAADVSLVYLGTNVPCVESAGLLVEGASTNLHVFSEQADNAAWNGGATLATVTADAYISPDGQATGDKIVYSGAGFKRGMNYAAAPVASFSVAVWLRADTATTTAITLALRDFTAGSDECTVTGTLTTTWQRFSCTGSNTNATHGIVPSIVSTGAVSIGVWGMQLEQQTFSTSYIPTTSTSAARAFDLINAGPVTLAANNKFSLSADVTLEGTQPSNGQAMVFETYNNASDQHFCALGSNQIFYCNYYNGLAGGGPVASTGPTFVAGVKHHVSQNYDGATWTAKVDGANAGTWSGSFTLASNVRTNVTIGSDGVNGNSDNIFGWISNVCMGNAGVCQ